MTLDTKWNPGDVMEHDHTLHYFNPEFKDGKLSRAVGSAILSSGESLVITCVDCSAVVETNAYVLLTPDSIVIIIRKR